MDAPAGEVLLFRPKRLRVLAIVMSLTLSIVVVIGWFALPLRLRDAFTWSQRLTLLALLGLLIFTMVAIAASYVRADDSGIHLRNGLRSHSVDWSRVHKVMLRPGDPWAILLLKPADGSPFEADLDAEKRQLMGIQAGDGEAARHAVQALQLRHRTITS
ncbi:MAG: PH domain-containing protein [Propionibacteriaceae bacterium]|nr:PH domain-containing protein [Propionibacteriaceae bacterium]